MSQYRCSGVTHGGCECKNMVSAIGDTCHWHTPLGGPDSNCSICMDVMTSRNFRELPCGHRFHSRCIRKWKSEGNRTCPLCRDEFDSPQFKITVNIDPIGPSANNFSPHSFDASRFSRGVMEMDVLRDFQMFNTELNFEAEDLNNLRGVLERIGIELDNSDLDALVRSDAE